MNTNFTWQSGTPFTPRVSGAAADVARGTNGTLRANYNGEPIQIVEPDHRSVLQHRRVLDPGDRRPTATPSRNLIIGPGSKSLNASFSRDVRMAGNRSVSINVNATNLLNLVQYAGDQHQRELADLRADHRRPTDALHLVELQCPLLTQVRTGGDRHEGFPMNRGRLPLNPGPSRLRMAFMSSWLLGSMQRAASAQQQPPRSTFRAGTTLVSVDLVVRDRAGAIVKGLKPEDFEVREDGELQKVLTFSFQEIDDKRQASSASVDLLGDIQAKVKEAATLSTSALAKPVAAPAEPPPRTDAVRGHRRPPPDRAPLRRELDGAGRRAAVASTPRRST